MRITLINQFYIPDVSPTAHLCASLASHRAQSGDTVTILTSGAGYVSTTRPAEQGSARSFSSGHIHVRRLWSTRFGSRSVLGRLLDWTSFYLPAFWAVAAMPRQDVVIALTTPPFIALGGWLHKLIHPSTRLVLWNMDVYPEALERTRLVSRGGVVSVIMRSASRAIFRRLDHLVALDRAMADLLLSQYTPPDRRIACTIIPNWESLAMFPRQPAATRPFREKLVVLYLGNAGFGHEFQTLLNAADQLRNDPVEFMFIGGGVLRSWIAAQCKDRNLSNITLNNYVPKEMTPQVMQNADCALITLENNMLGVMSPSKLHANLAMGLPIIYVGPERSNVDDAIARFGCGISLRPGQPSLFATFLRTLIADRQKLSDLQQSARTAFEQAYCDRVALAHFDEVVAAVTGSSQRDKGPTGPDHPAP